MTEKKSHNQDRMVPGMTLAEIAKSELPLPDLESLTEEERAAFEYILERSKLWFKSTSSTEGESEYRMSPYYQGLLQIPLVALKWIELTDLFGQSESRGCFSVRDREWIRVVVPPLLKNVPIHGLQIADAIAAGIAPTDIKAILDDNLDELAPEDRELVEYIRAVFNGESTQEQFKKMEARMGRKGACEYNMSILYVAAMRRGVQSMWAAQGIKVAERSKDYEIIQSYIDGTAKVHHNYDRLGGVARGMKESRDNN